MATAQADAPQLTFADLEGRDVIDVPTAAKVLGIGRNSAYEACQRGDIPSIRLGHRVIVPVARLRAMVEGNGGGR